MPQASLVVELPQGGYPIYIETRPPRTLNEVMPSWGPERSICLISDEKVADLNQDRIDAWLADRVAVSVVMAPGEASKSLGTLETVLNEMARAGATRSWGVVCFGGGVVGDLGGLAAALFMRGLPFVQLPTTLLAQVDSAVGGKTAVNLSSGKNLAGVFQQPEAVWADVSALATLSDADYRSGLGEILKYSLLEDEGGVEFLERTAPGLVRREPAILVDMVRRSLETKTRFVVADEFEQGIRTHLNLGHSVGHGLEHAAGSRGEALPHGVAVALGIIAELELGVLLGVTDPALPDRMRATSRALGLPVGLADIDAPRVLEFMRRDKKRLTSGSLSSVLVSAPGKLLVRHDIPEELVTQSLVTIGD